MADPETPRTPPLRVALRILLVLASSALTIFCLLLLRAGMLRLVSLALAGSTGVTARYQARLVDIVGTLLFGIAAIAFVIFVEWWYRAGQRRGVMGRRFATTTGILVFGMAASHLAMWISGGFGLNLTLGVAAVELVAGLALVLLPRFLRARMPH